MTQAPHQTSFGDRSTKLIASDSVRWRLFVGFVIAAGGVLLSVAAWSGLGSREREAVEARLGLAASEIARALESSFAQESEQLRDLAQTWGRFGAEEEAPWHAEANRFRQLHAGCLALEWVSSMLPAVPLATGTPEGLAFLASRPADAAAAEARRSAVAGGFDAVFGPWPIEGGRSVLEILVPVPIAEAEVKILTAVVDPAVTIERVVAPWLENYGIDVSVGAASLFRRGEAPAAELYRLAERRSLAPGVAGQEWSLAVQPGTGLLAAPRLPMRNVVLVGGILLTILVTLAYSISQIAFLRARELRDARVELHEQRRSLHRVRKDRQALTEGMLSMKVEMENRSSAGGGPDPATSELETFTYSVSHDLRSPMGAILNYVGVLDEDYHDVLGPEGRGHLQRITASAQKAIAMMDGLLAFSRVGSRDLKIVEIDVAAMVREIHNQLSESLRYPEHPPELSMGELPPVRADRTLVWTLFTNLLSNAFKFTQRVEDPRVEVGGYAQDDEVVYYVKDNGIGFDMRHADKLFHVFERLPTRERHDGHGLGLAVVERITRRHGGSVRAEAVPDKGATFFVTLPSIPLQPNRNGPEPTGTT